MSDEKQIIEEMAKFVCNACEMGNGFDGECALDNDYRKCHLSVETAEALYNAGYRKQSEGEWIEKDDGFGGVYYDCTACGCSWTTIDGTPFENNMNFCPECGAKMKGGE